MKHSQEQELKNGTVFYVRSADHLSFRPYNHKLYLDTKPNEAVEFEVVGFEARCYILKHKKNNYVVLASWVNYEADIPDGDITIIGCCQSDELKTTQKRQMNLCPLCSSSGYTGLISFECDNKECENG